MRDVVGREGVQGGRRGGQAGCHHELKDSGSNCGIEGKELRVEL